MVGLTNAPKYNSAQYMNWLNEQTQQTQPHAFSGFLGNSEPNKDNWIMQQSRAQCGIPEASAAVGPSG